MNYKTEQSLTDALQPVAWIRKNGFRFNAEAEPQDDSETALYSQTAIDTLRAQLAEAQRDAEVNKQINRACMELPDDFRIAIELEPNAACVYLLQEGEDIGSYDPCEGIASSISAAIDAAKGPA